MMAMTHERIGKEERVVRTRNRLLLGNVAAFGVWQVGDMLRDVSSRGVAPVFLAASLAGALAWMVTLAAVIHLRKRIASDPALRALAEDERAAQVRLRAYRAAFWATVGSAALLGVPAAAHVLGPLAITKMLVVIGVATFVGSFVFFDRE
jgi:hypothetical protein